MFSMFSTRDSFSLYMYASICNPPAGLLQRDKKGERGMCMSVRMYTYTIQCVCVCGSNCNVHICKDMGGVERGRERGREGGGGGGGGGEGFLCYVCTL